MSNKSKNDNELLVEFDFLVDIDLAIYKYIKDKYFYTDYVDKDILSIEDENKIKSLLLFRKHINPLEIIMPNFETTKLYIDLYTNHKNELLEYATPYDTLYLMVTYLNRIQTVGITILCKNKEEENFIKNINDKFNCIICSDRKSLDISKYTAIYLKYFITALEFVKIEGKYIYILTGKFNFDENSNTINGAMSIIYGDLNIIKLIDPYTNIKYRFIEGDNDNEENILEHSPSGESEGDSKGDSWDNFGFFN